VVQRLAIDLGSSNTVAVQQGPDGQVRPLLFDGSELLPSAVCADVTGGLVVGRDAQRLARADPGAYEPCPKRRIDDGTMLLGGQLMDVREALAAVLGRAGGQPRPGGGEPASVVLTFPAGWGLPRRTVLAEAGARAGLGSVRLVSEPVAAAAYFTTVLRHRLPPGAALAVVDVGAGTADVAVVRRSGGPGCGDISDGLDVVAQAGLEVGGLDIDAALVDRVGAVASAAAPEAWRALAEPATPGQRRDRLLLWHEVCAAKESLSRLSVAPVHVPGHDADLHLTREELEAVATPLLLPVGDLVAQVIAAAGLTPDQLAGVFLVGGGSRIPLLARLLHARLAVAPTVVERPETVVAEGALYATARTEPASDVPAIGPAASPPRESLSRRSAARRWPSATVLVLAVLSFLLPFATVSCGLPGGYGRATPGGTTTYTGVDLVVGGVPDVPAKYLRPRFEQRNDRLPPQPLLLAALLTAMAAAVAVVAARPRRRAVVAALATVSAVALLAGQAVAVGQLITRVEAHSPLPAGKTADDFVNTSVGFWLALALMTAAGAGNAVGLLRHRHDKNPLRPPTHPPRQTGSRSGMPEQTRLP
jgi:actin-like ATPase involved in cell morphogenesis